MMKSDQNNFFEKERPDFRNLLDHYLHPSGNVSIPAQLKGREAPLSHLRDCFETSGAQAFIWGPRGVGKTSLAHTACEVHGDIVEVAAAVSCEKETTFSQLMNDVFVKVVHRNTIPIGNKALQTSLKAFGFTFSGGLPVYDTEVNIGNVNAACALLNTIFKLEHFPEKKPVVIVDEFDRLDNPDTFRLLSSLLKQMTVDDIRVQFVFCGVADDLDELLGSHESVERYVYGVELPPLSYEAMTEIITDIETEFNVSFHRGQQVRITQIASGYAGFTHLILKNTLLAIYEGNISSIDVNDQQYKTGVQRSAEQAATRLKTSYERAIKQGTDRYIEVLWAAANNQHLDRQFKDIAQDYENILSHRPNRSGYDLTKNNGADLRNALNSLVKRKYLERGRSGWYSFVDPMFRSYVRLMAEREDIELGTESFPA